jgi:hypothetical protein
MQALFLAACWAQCRQKSKLFKREGQPQELDFKYISEVQRMENLYEFVIHTFIK